jgi:hypothetical protein
VPVDGQLNGVVVDHVRVAERRATHELNANTFTLHREALLEKKVRAYLAGRIAQRRFSPWSWRSRHDSGDQERAMELSIRASGDSERTASAWMRLLSIQIEDLIERSLVCGRDGCRRTRDPSGFCRQRRRAPCAGRRSTSSCT